MQSSYVETGVRGINSQLPKAAVTRPRVIGCKTATPV